MSSYRTLRGLLSVLALTSAIGASAVKAQEARAVGVTPPRLSFLDGAVSYWRPGADDWVPAQINTALAAGDSLYAADSGNVEVEIGARGYVRAGSGTQLGVESLETGYLQLRVPAGHAAVDLRRLPSGQEIEVDTPNGAFLISHTGYYRFDVDDAATRFSARHGGLARVVPAGGGDEVEIGSTQQVVVSGTETARLERVALSSDDAWDRWNADRMAGLSDEPRSQRYVSPEVAGVDDLDRYGDWRNTPSYGSVWVPRGVAADWSPYSTGRWVWDGYYGWTWVDDSPWGWAPYHYGRWCQVDGYWGWAPGPVVAQPVYSPALVAFFGGPHVGVSVSIGTPFVSWVPLGWGEPVVPWWGPRGFVGRPYWGGWGGPRVVNNVVINNTTIVNVDNINRYDNVRYRNAVMGVDGDRFGRGRITPVRLDSDRVRNLRPVRGELGVRPVRESLVPGRDRGRGERPPDRIQNRRVVATRAPQDPARQPRASGLVGAGGRGAPEPRIVAPRTDRSRGVERTRGRDVPPDIQRGAAVERGRGATERPSSDVRGSLDPRGGEMRGSNAAERNDRVPGVERGERTRGEPQPPAQPPSIDTRVPRERDRQGRDIGTNVERRGVDREPTAPAAERGRGAERARGGSRDDVPPPRAAVERGNSRIEQPGIAPRDSERRQDGGNQRPERTERAPRNEASERPARIQQPEPAPRMQQPSRAPRNDRASREVAPPRSFGNEGGGRGERQRVEQPQRQPEWHQPQRIQIPRMEAPNRGERQSAREVQRGSSKQRGSEPQRHEAPPRAERGGGGDQRSNQPRNDGGHDGSGHGKKDN